MCVIVCADTLVSVFHCECVYDVCVGMCSHVCMCVNLP